MIYFSFKTKDYISHVSVSVKPNEKVGIVGIGNSCFYESLFRLNNINTGNIFIDGVDIATLNLIDLRSNLNIITVFKQFCLHF